MLELRIGQTKLPLPKDFSLGFELVTNVLNIAERNENSYTLPIPVPMTDHVAQLIGYSWQPQVQYDLSQVFPDCAVVLDGNDFWLGAIEISNINDQRVTFNFRTASGYVPTINKRTRLRDFFREKTFTLVGNVAATYSIFWPTDVKHLWYEIDIGANIGFDSEKYRETVNDSPESIDYHLNALATAVAADTNVATCTWNSSTGTMTLQMELNAGVVMLPGYYTAEGDLVIPNTASVVELQFTSQSGKGTIYELPPLYVPNLYDGQAPNYVGYANTQDIGLLYNMPANIEDIQTTIIPCLKTSWLLQELFKDFGMGIGGTWFSDVETSQRLEFVPRPIDHEILENDLTVGIEVDYSVADFLPDISLSEWLLAIKQESCTSLTFDTNKLLANMNLVEGILNSTDYEDWTPYLVDWEPVKPIRYNGHRLGFNLDRDDQELKAFALERETFTLGPPVANMTALQASDPANYEIRFVESKNAFYRFIFTQWYFHSYNLDDDKEGEEESNIRSSYSPLVDTLVNFQDKIMRMPKADVVGFLPALELTEDNYSPRFTIYRGLQKDLQDNDYPMAAADVHKADETQITGSTTTFSPAIAPTSLKEIRHAAYIRMLKNNVEYPVILDLPKKVLQSFDQTKKKRIEGVNFIVMRLSGEIGHSSTSYIRAVLKRVP